MTISQKDIVAAIKAAIKAGIGPAPKEIQDRLAAEIETARKVEAKENTEYETSRTEYLNARDYGAPPAAVEAAARKMEKTGSAQLKTATELRALEEKAALYRENVIMVQIGKWQYVGTPEQAMKMIKQKGVSTVAKKHGSPSLSSGLPELAVKVPVTGVTPELLEKFLDPEKPGCAKSHHSERLGYTMATNRVIALLTPGKVGDTFPANVEQLMASYISREGQARTELGTVNARSLATAARTMCAASGHTRDGKVVTFASFFVGDDGDVSACSRTETNVLSPFDLPVERVVYGFPLDATQVPGQYNPENIFTIARAMLQAGEDMITLATLEQPCNGGKMHLLQFMGAKNQSLFAITSYRPETTTETEK